MLDDFQRRHRAGCNHLLGAFQGIYHNVPGQVLGNPLPYQKQSAKDRQGQQYPGDDPDQIAVEVAYAYLGLSRQASDKGDAGSIAAGRGNKHHKGNDHHLGQIRHACFSGIVLQVGVGHKADDGVEGQGRLHSFNPIGIKQCTALYSQDQVTQHHHNGVGAQQRQGIFFPIHLPLGLDTADFIHQSIHPVKQRVRKGRFPGGDAVNISANRNHHDHVNQQGQDNLQHDNFLLTTSKLLRVNQGINQITTQQQYNNSKNRHIFPSRIQRFRLLFAAIQLFFAPADKQQNQPHTGGQNGHHHDIHHRYNLLFFMGTL